MRFAEHDTHLAFDFCNDFVTSEPKQIDHIS